MFSNPADITQELQSRIDEYSRRGGGEILIPPGEYHFRPIRLKSGICLNLSAGARLVASPHPQDYFPIGYHHNEMGEVTSALYAMQQEHITLKGEGVIDLNGSSFYHMDRPTPVVSTGPGITQADLGEAPRTYDWRVNQPIFFHQCRFVRLEGITVLDAPCWTFSFNFCRVIRVSGLTIQNSLVLPNCDGLHFTGSSEILVQGCHITAGDDCLAFTSITDWNVPCENVVVSNCILQSASKAISIGYMHSIVRNVLIENVIVRKSNRALVIMCHPRTGLVENVRLNNCILEGRSYSGNWWGNGEAIVLMVIPHHIPTYRDAQPAARFQQSVRNVTFSNTTCLAERSVGILASEPLVENLQIKDMVIQILPEERPSLKGNVIDLAPGPQNAPIPRPGIGIVYRNASFRIENVVDDQGKPVEVVAI
jgi:hypothetical protein